MGLQVLLFAWNYRNNADLLQVRWYVMQSDGNSNLASETRSAGRKVKSAFKNVEREPLLPHRRSLFYLKLNLVSSRTCALKWRISFFQHLFLFVDAFPHGFPSTLPWPSLVVPFLRRHPGLSPFCCSEPVGLGPSAFCILSVDWFWWVTCLCTLVLQALWE